MANRLRWLTVGIVVLVLLSGCSSPELCRGEVGPETVVIDAEAFANDGIQVCFTIADGPETYCSESGTPKVSWTARSDYPQDVPYFVRITTSVGETFPEGGSGTHRMTCTQTTTEIILPTD
jgi:hypothetical protein